jgi:3'(2'), 5'-bisphosphate nucleotidase
MNHRNPTHESEARAAGARRLVDSGQIEQVIDIARRAAAAILEVYRSVDVRESAKADNSPLTAADLRSHRLIVAALARLTPAIPVLSEEAPAVPAAERAGWGCYWLVDPLDGTREFLTRNGEFTVNIALVIGGEPRLGVVLAPALDRLYYGIPGKGAWRVDGRGRPSAIRAQQTAADPVRVVGSRSHRGDSLDAFLARVGRHEFTPIGSSLKFCLIAEGAADVYPRLGPTSKWDTAAAQAVVVAAGGIVVDTQGAPITYGAAEDVRNPSFLCYADRGRDWLALIQ